MYHADEALKELYRSDSIEKYLTAEFRHPGAEAPFLTVYEGEKFFDMSLEESLSSDENLNFGSCEASQIKLTVIDLEGEINGSEMTLYQTLDGIYPDTKLYPAGDLFPAGYFMPLGKYVIQSAEQQANQKYRDIVALDFMYKFDVEVIDWYDALPFPLTLRDFRARLCRHVGIKEHVPDYLPNDGMMVEKTIEAATLMGRAVLIACEQVNGVFGHFDRNGVLQHVTLQPNYALLPAPNLYPSNDLFPVLPGEMNQQVYDERITRNLYMTCQIEEHTVRSIDKVQIRQEEGDIGAIYGSGTNCLTVEGNFLVFGKGADELGKIAMGIYGMVSGRQYIPYSLELKGLPYLEVGDTELIETEQGEINTYIIQRTLKGIYALKDTHSATGEEIRSVEHNINTEIIQLKGKAAILKRNVEEVSAELVDFEAETSAKFKITAEQISAEVKRAQEAEAALTIRADQIAMSVKDLKEETEASFKITAEEIAAEVRRAKEAEASLKLTADSITMSVKDLKTETEAGFKMTAGLIEMKVSKGDVSSQLSIEEDQISLLSNRLIVDSTNFKLDDKGNATFSGNVSGATITSGSMNGTSINVGVFSADDEGVKIGGFESRIAWGRDIIQSSDGSTGMSAEPYNEGGVYLWAGWNSDIDFAFAVNNRGETHAKGLWLHEWLESDLEYLESRFPSTVKLNLDSFSANTVNIMLLETYQWKNWLLDTLIGMFDNIENRLDRLEGR